MLLISRAHTNQAGGMERLSFELRAELEKLPALEVTHISHTGPRWLAPLFVVWSMPLVLWRARSVDVLHFGDPLLSFSAWLTKLVLRKPMCVTVHGLDISYPSFLYQVYLKLFFGHFDRYIAISRHVASILKQKNMSLPVTVINPAVGDTTYDASIRRSKLSEILGRTTDKNKTLLTVGRLVARKGHVWFMINVLPHLPADTLYVIAGDGPERETINRTSEKLGLEDRVYVLGRVSDETLRVLYNTVDAFIQPNIVVEGDVEGFGLVLLEAALCNRPVFAANIEGISDAIVDGKNGTLLPAQDDAAWQAALKNLPVVKDGTNSPRDYTHTHYSWEIVTRKYADVLAASALKKL